VYWSLDLVEDEYRRPPMMMDGLFVVRLQGYLKHSKPLVLEDDLVVLWSRRFPPPWSVEVTPNCFIVRDANDQQIAYIYNAWLPMPLLARYSHSTTKLPSH